MGIVRFRDWFGKAPGSRREVYPKLLSSSLLGLPYRILNINHKKELLRGLWVRFAGCRAPPQTSLALGRKSSEAAPGIPEVRGELQLPSWYTDQAVESRQFHFLCGESCLGL